MEFLSELFHRLRDLPALVQWAGYFGLTAIIFTETGLFVGFFLPGDSLLVTAGLLASQPDFRLNVYAMGALFSIAAILGDTVGYSVGRASGPRIFTREDSLFFSKKHLYRAHAFYEKHGGKTIIYARFVPIIRTFAPFVAGVGRMDYKRFLSFNVFGGIGWVFAMTMLGYVLGGVTIVKENLEKVILLIILISVAPVIAEGLKAYRKAKAPLA